MFRSLRNLFSPSKAKPGSAIKLAESHGGKGYGTLGGLIEWNGDTCALTCAHVLERGQVGDIVRLYDRHGKLESKTLGTIVRLPKRSHENSDAALVRVRHDTPVTRGFPTHIGPINPDPIRVGELNVSSRTSDAIEVVGTGALTPEIHGHALIGALSTFARNTTPSGSSSRKQRKRAPRFRMEPPLIMIQSGLEKTYHTCKKGDSGSIIFKRGSGNEHARPLGLLVALIPNGGLPSRGVAIPLDRVLDELGHSARLMA